MKYLVLLSLLFSPLLIAAPKPVESLTDAEKLAFRGHLGINLSQVGGNLKIPQYDAVGDLTIGPWANDGTLYGAEDINIPDGGGINWLSHTTGLPLVNLSNYQNHDANGGEFLVSFQNRMAVWGRETIQIGNNASGRDGQNLYFTSGPGTVTDTLRSSKAVSFQTSVWTGAASASKLISIQGVPLDTTGTNNVLQFHDSAVLDLAWGSATAGQVTSGTKIGEMALAGFWNPGITPSTVPLEDGVTITHTPSKYKTINVASVTLGGNRTLAITGAQAGMRGVIYVKQDATGTRLLTLPSGSATTASWALSTVAYTIDRLQWEYDGTYYFWTIDKGILTPVDSDAAAFIAAASITDDAQETAINEMVLALKGASLWTKFYAIYPFVGASATAHSKDLKAAYNITNSGTWTTGVTHDANGITGNGTDGYGNTNFKFSDVSAKDSASLYVYCKTASPTTGKTLIGASGSDASRFAMRSYSASLLSGNGPNLNFITGYYVDVATAPALYRQHFSFNRSSSSTATLYGNSDANKHVVSSTSLSACNANVFILALGSSGTPSEWSNANLGMAAMGQSLSDAEWTTFRAIVTAYQTALGRQN